MARDLSNLFAQMKHINYSFKVLRKDGQQSPSYFFMPANPITKGRIIWQSKGNTRLTSTLLSAHAAKARLNLNGDTGLQDGYCIRSATKCGFRL